MSSTSHATAHAPVSLRRRLFATLALPAAVLSCPPRTGRIARKYLGIGAAVALGLAVMVTARPASADVLAYASVNPFGGSGEFGIVDLTTGGFTQAAQSPGSVNSGNVAGLAIGPNGVLYAAGEYTPYLWTVNPLSGATTLVGTMNTIGGSDANGWGSTNSAFYLTDRAGNLYQVDPSTGNLTYIANIGAMELSTNSATLVGALGSALYTIDTTTGATTLIGSPSIDSSTTYAWASLTEIDGVLYGSPNSLGGGVYTIDTSDDTASYVGGSDVFWGLAPEASDFGAIPEPATWALLLAGVAGLAAIRRTKRG